ncbi:hypothetical protein PT2222_390028 [Paraburkholderia tropica]
MLAQQVAQLPGRIRGLAGKSKKSAASRRNALIQREKMQF